MVKVPTRVGSGNYQGSQNCFLADPVAARVELPLIAVAFVQAVFTSERHPEVDPRNNPEPLRVRRSANDTPHPNVAWFRHTKSARASRL